LDRTGYLDKINNGVILIYKGRDGLDTDGGEREGRISFQTGLAIALDTFKKIQLQVNEDLELLILAEYVFLGQELQFCASSDTNAKTSLTRAIQEFDEAFLALGVLQNTEVYKSLEKAISHRPEFRYKEMPKDAFHVACAGHRVRIQNILKSPGINLAEKELLKQRYSNMGTAQSVYLEKQKEILVSI
jgi:hypothetical protein